MIYDRIAGFKPGREAGELSKALSGKIHVSVFFVSQISDRWKADTTAVVKKSLADAECWLAKEAARFGKSVSFTNSYFGDEHEKPILVKDFQTYSFNPSRKELLKIQKKRGLDEWETYKKFVREEMGCERGIIIFIYIKPSMSYALYSRADYKFSATVCHKNDCAGILAHEILHLFGAWDMYKRSFDKGNARAHKCSLYFNKSIMYQAFPMVNQEIDEINAWLVGLKEEEKSWYYLFFPSWEAKEEQIWSLQLYRDWRNGEYSDRPVPPKPYATIPAATKKKPRPLDSWKDFKEWVKGLWT